MAENKSRPKRFILRRFLVAAAVAGLAAALALGANAATDGRLLEEANNIAVFLKNGEKGEISVVSDEDGRLRIDSRVLEAEKGGAGKASIIFYDADGKRRSIVLEEGADYSTVP